MTSPAPDRPDGDVTAPSPHGSRRKVSHGQFFTRTDPFAAPALHRWLATIPAGATFCEPYAGANNLVRLFERHRPGARWTSYDIEPAHPSVQRRDTVAAPVCGFDVIVTNPPYLARNSAARRGLHAAAAACDGFDNLYKRCLRDCLAGAAWVAAIIPESFVTAGLFHDRLVAVVSLTERMFADTEQPTCLALWGPSPSPGFDVWAGPRRLGSFAELLACWPSRPADAVPVAFNRRDGNVGLVAIDPTAQAGIRFTLPGEIAAADVKPTSRHRTRAHVAGIRDGEDALLVATANALLVDARTRSGDVGMTAFMGLRHDGRFRRRLDFDRARTILQAAAAEILATREDAG